MGVVYVDGHLFGQVVEGAVLPQVAAEDILHRGRNQEVLLTQPQALALHVVVLGVEDLADDLGHGVLLHSLDVFALVEEVHVDAVGLVGAPEAQQVDGPAVLARDQHVVGHRPHHRAVGLLDMVVGPVPPFLDMPVKLHVHGRVVPRLQPDAAAGQPELGHLGLPTLHQLLAEDAVVVLDAVAHGRVTAGRQAVQEAGGQAAQAAVA